MNNKKSFALTIGSVMVTALSATPLAHAQENPFGMQNIDNVQVLAKADGKMAEGGCSANKMKEGKCGEGKCGANKTKMKEAGCSGSATATEKMQEAGCSGKLKEGGCSGKM